MPAITLLPLSVTVVGAVFALVLLNRYFSGKKRPHELIWGVSFSLFAIASACQVYADLAGHWTATTAQLYYLTGAILTVGLLGVGTVYLLFSRRVANMALIVMLLFSALSTVVVFSVPVDHSVLGQDSGYQAVVNIDRLPRYLAALSNSIGTLLVAGGALWSAYVFWRKRIMKERMVGVLLIALGVTVTAVGGSILGLTGLTNPEYHYVGMLVGVVIMFVGYLQSIRVSLPRPAVVETVVERAL
ncbi:MAG: hypothetical protein WCD37_15120 [Chloroflexia bacterium]